MPKLKLCGASALATADIRTATSSGRTSPQWDLPACPHTTTPRLQRGALRAEHGARHPPRQNADQSHALYKVTLRPRLESSKPHRRSTTKALCCMPVRFAHAPHVPGHPRVKLPSRVPSCTIRPGIHNLMNVPKSRPGMRSSVPCCGFGSPTIRLSPSSTPTVPATVTVTPRGQTHQWVSSAFHS